MACAEVVFHTVDLFLYRRDTIEHRAVARRENFHRQIEHFDNLIVHLPQFRDCRIGKRDVLFVHFLGLFDEVLRIVAYALDVAYNVVIRAHKTLVGRRKRIAGKRDKVLRNHVVSVVYARFVLLYLVVAGRVERKNGVYRSGKVFFRNARYINDLFGNLRNRNRRSLQKAVVHVSEFHFLFFRRGFFAYDKFGYLYELIDKRQ